MTKDEAEQTAQSALKERKYTDSRDSFVGGVVDILAALGVLKLEKPKSLNARLAESINKHVILGSPMVEWEIETALKAADLELIERKD